MRPTPAGVNHWYWEEVNESLGPVTVCFRWRRDEEPELTPFDGAPYEPPAEGALPARGCDPDPIPTGARIPYDWHLTALQHRGRYRWCASEWSITEPGRGNRLSETCSTVAIDAEPPIVGVALSDAAGHQGATNNPAGLRRAITYADDTSPAWGDTRLCRISERRCLNNGLDPFDYDRDCSDEPRGTTTVFMCGWAWPYGDSRIYQCALSFDSAVSDRAPDLNRGPAPDNPDYSPPGTGNFAIGCDSIVVDRMPPRLGLRAPTQRGGALPGEPIRFTASMTDDLAGPSGTWGFMFGDGKSTESSQPVVDHAYTQPGTYLVSAYARDAAGNLSYVLRTVEVTAGDRLAVQVPPKLRAGRRLVRFVVSAAHAGNALLELQRGGETVAAADADLERPGVLGINVRLDPPAKAGRYRLHARFTRTGSERTTDERWFSVRFARRR